jgi:hypothetical protein
MTLPNLPDRKPMFDDAGYPTTPTRVWWQAVKRVFDATQAPSRTRTLTATGAALASDYLLLVNATAGAVTVNLPAAASSNGVYLIVKKTDASVNAVTVDADGAETIDGAATQVLSAQYDAVTVFCDGSGWWIV